MQNCHLSFHVSCILSKQPKKKMCYRRTIHDYVSDSEDSDECGSDNTTTTMLRRFSNLHNLNKAKKVQKAKEARHIKSVHKGMPQVSEALQLPKKKWMKFSLG